MNKYLHLTLVLFIISALSGILLGATNLLTKDKIAENQRIKIENGIKQIFPDASYRNYEGFEKGKILLNLYEVLDENEEVIGYVFNVNGPKAMDEINALVGIDVEGKITGIAFIKVTETKGIGDVIMKKSFYEQYLGEPKASYDTIAGSTISTRSMNEAVMEAQKYFQEHLKK